MKSNVIDAVEEMNKQIKRYSINQMRDQVKQVAKIEDMLEELCYRIQGHSEENDRLLCKAIESTHEVWKILWSEFIDYYWEEKDSHKEDK